MSHSALSETECLKAPVRARPRRRAVARTALSVRRLGGFGRIGSARRTWPGPLAGLGSIARLHLRGWTWPGPPASLGSGLSSGVPLMFRQAMPWAAGLRHWLRVPKRQGFPVDTQDGPHPPRIPRHTRRTASAKDSHKTDHIRQGFPITEDGPHPPRIPRRHTRRTASGECGFQGGVLGPCGAFLVPGCLSPSDLTGCACLLAWDSWVLVWSTRVCLAQ